MVCYTHSNLFGDALQKETDLTLSKADAIIQRGFWEKRSRGKSCLLTHAVLMSGRRGVKAEPFEEIEHIAKCQDKNDATSALFLQFLPHLALCITQCT